MTGVTTFITIFFCVSVLVFVLRLFGAWMFRINEIIDLQKKSLDSLNEILNNVTFEENLDDLDD